jgi:hypothetical protein
MSRVESEKSTAHMILFGSNLIALLHYQSQLFLGHPSPQKTKKTKLPLEIGNPADFLAP